MTIECHQQMGDFFATRLSEVASFVTDDISKLRYLILTSRIVTYYLANITDEKLYKL